MPFQVLKPDQYLGRLSTFFRPAAGCAEKMPCCNNFFFGCRGATGRDLLIDKQGSMMLQVLHTSTGDADA